MSDRANASRFQDGPTVSQGWPLSNGDSSSVVRRREVTPFAGTSSCAPDGPSCWIAGIPALLCSGSQPLLVSCGVYSSPD